jgi:tetratricopeptide (TPR) repeat protein
MSKRLGVLEKMVAGGAGDSFTFYALAMEYRSLGRGEDALRTFTELREKDAEYVPMYLMAGQLLSEMGRNSDARGWFEAGIEAADRAGDGKAKSELSTALAECD